MNSLKNKVQLIGRLGQDPEVINFTDGGKIVKFSLAVDDSYKDKQGNKIERTYWHQIVVKNGLVKVAENYLKKGKEIVIEGKLINRFWLDKNENKQYATEIVVNELFMLRGE